MNRILKNIAKRGVTGIRWRFMPNGLYCFNYHRIGDSRDTLYDSDIYSCDVDTFESHIRFYNDNFDLVPMEDLYKIIDNKQKINSRIALITFDDGYIDNYQNAYQLLKRYATPAVFFIPTSYVESGIVPWWDEIAWMVRNTQGTSVSLKQWRDDVYIDRENIDKTIRTVLLNVKKTYDLQMNEILSQLRQTMQCQLDARQEGKLFMDWNQLKEMRDNGMEIGSHTHTHEILSHIDAAAQGEELSRSKQILEQQLKTEILSFAYPVGRAGTYGEEAIGLLGKCGYKLAFTQLLGVNKDPGMNRYELRRFPVDDNIPAEKIPELICLN